MNTAALITAYALIGMGVCLLILGGLSYVTWRTAKAVWANLRNIYSITVVTYWLQRLEREGWRTFERARTKQDDHA